MAVRILTISGSLRAASINTALLHAFAALAPASVEVVQCQLIGQLPLFNPDLSSAPPPAVSELYAQICAAEVLVIASPEYAHGVTGSIKNALDWCVGFENFVAKPVLVLQSRARSVYADSALRETLQTMSAQLLTTPSFPVQLDATCFDVKGMLQSELVCDRLCQAHQIILEKLSALKEQAGLNEDKACQKF
jgi:NAD(P)H-dependent FMN reductase